MRENQFEWVGFYGELANKLIQYKNKRQELVGIVNDIYADGNVRMPLLELENDLIDIDPFTIFGLFNRYGMPPENRKLVANRLAAAMGISRAVPEFPDEIPVLDTRNAVYYRFKTDRNDDDIDILWNLFESALSFSYGEDCTSELSIYFDKAIRLWNNGNAKITMGLFWIAPDTFMSFNYRNQWYIYDSGKLPEDVVQRLPPRVSKIDFETYQAISKTVADYMQTADSPVKDFKQLNYYAWEYSEQINNMLSKNANSDEKSESSERPIETPYRKDDFLRDVYMSEEDYDELSGLAKSSNLILQGAPGVGKTYVAMALAYSLIGLKSSKRVQMVQFHQNYSYEDFVEGYRPVGGDFALKDGVFKAFCQLADADHDNDYYFIIDEINRGNLSKIFGELFMLIELSKRGNTKISLLYSGDSFSIPKNIHIIGTMNTTDRSIAMMDYAMRRRFTFYDLKPGFETKEFMEYIENREDERLSRVVSAVRSINDVIELDDSLGEGFKIGHSFFCNIEDEDSDCLNRVVRYELEPLIREYWFDRKEQCEEQIGKLERALQ
ncbi:AAA family ATPase [Bifidobacterium aemilianum]|uniref:AAA family ATPase n=1 Tax=Bifidobacterium aemilianum TaxID=2493120 RepID=A0A366K801_9BIFI|nr:AAA family ATPase [Bifidobacterium aemilianum]RBP97288.1 AAA family ATPase [Bifidobacterium aemilianum]